MPPRVSCALWLVVVALGHIALWRGFAAAPPEGSYRQLATYLESHGIEFIVTDYWTGYRVAFLTGERVRAETSFNRVHEHLLAVRANRKKAVEVRRRGAPPCEDGVEVGAFYVCR